MAQNITLLGADYQDVPAVALPKTGGGMALFVDSEEVAVAKTIGSGSLHDLTTPGIYYLRNAVTDKPTATGGTYIVSSYSGTVSGLFIQASSGNAYTIVCNGGTWTVTAL